MKGFILLCSSLLAVSGSLPGSHYGISHDTVPHKQNLMMGHPPHIHVRFGQDVASHSAHGANTEDSAYVTTSNSPILGHPYGGSTSYDYGLPAHHTTAFDVAEERSDYKSHSSHDVPQSPTSPYAAVNELTQDVPPSSAYKKISHDVSSVHKHVGPKTSRRKKCKHASHTPTTTSLSYEYAVPTTAPPSTRFSVHSILHPNTLPASHLGATHASEHIPAHVDTTLGGHPSTPLPDHLYTTSVAGHAASLHIPAQSHSVPLSHLGTHAPVHMPEHTAVAPHAVTHLPALHEVTSPGHKTATLDAEYVSKYEYAHGIPVSHVTEHIPAHPRLISTAHLASHTSKHPHVLTTTTAIRHGAAHISGHHAGASTPATTSSYPRHVVHDQEVSHLTDAHTKAVDHLVAFHKNAHSGSLASCKHFHATKKAAHAHVAAVHHVATAHKRMHTGTELMESGKASYISPKSHPIHYY